MDKLFIYEAVRDEYIHSLEYVRDHLKTMNTIGSYMFRRNIHSGICSYMIQKFDFFLTRISVEFPEIAEYRACTARGQIVENTSKHQYWVKTPVYCDTKEEILYVLQVRIDILTKIISELKSSS